MPGDLSYAAGEGGTQANQVFYLRGFPRPATSSSTACATCGEYNRDLFATESVEVLKGPSALMFGRGSTGGVINQVSKPPIARPHGGRVTSATINKKRLTADLNCAPASRARSALVASPRTRAPTATRRT